VSVTPLSLYVASHGSIIDSHQPFDPARCPCTTHTDFGRTSRSQQCQHKPRADKVRPVADHSSRDLTAAIRDMAVCGMHARQYDKQEESDRRYREERAQANADDAKSAAGAAALMKWGIDARPASHGKIVVDADEVLAALERR
jgi:hypothetical protein